MPLFQDPNINKWWRDPTLRAIATGPDARRDLFCRFYSGNYFDFLEEKDREDKLFAQADRIISFVRRRQKIEAILDHSVSINHTLGVITSTEV